MRILTQEKTAAAAGFDRGELTKIARLRVSAHGGTIVIGLTGRSKGPVKDRGLNDEVLDLAEQLG